MNGYLADLRLLRRRITYGIACVLLIVSGMLVWISRRAAGRQLRVIVDGLRDSGVDPLQAPCGVLINAVSTNDCMALIPSTVDRVFPQSLLGYYPAVIESSQLTSSPAGLLMFASRQVGTMVGLVALILIVCAHVSSLWETGTSRWLIPRIGLRRLLFQKAATVFVVALVLPVICWLGSMLGMLIPTGYSVPKVSASFSAGLIELVRAWVVLIIVGMLALGISAWCRAMVVSFVISAGVLGLSFFGTLDPDLYFFSPAGWLATILALPRGDYRQVVDYLWVPSVGGGSSALSIVGLVAIAALPLLGAVIFLRRARPLA